MPPRWLHSEDELYDSLRGPAEAIAVLATAWSDPGTGGTARHEPVMMTIRYGKGRVFNTTLGHELKGMQSVGFRTTFARGTEWVATGEVTLPAPTTLVGSAGPVVRTPPPRPPAPAVSAAAVRGEAVYLREGSCVACHQTGGDGVAGSFPPLAGSDWVTGDVGRLMRIVLHGVQGRRVVKGAAYDALMPGQGALLTDAEIADVLTYVRQSWGNRAGAVSESMVAQGRATYSERVDPWTVEELAGAPVAAKAGEAGIERLVRRIYPGRWDRLPDFTALSPTIEEAQPRNRVSIENSVAERDFGMAFSGQLRTTNAGAYRFELTADDGAVLRIGGTEVVRIDGIGPGRMAAGEAVLQPGTHAFELDYFCARGHPQLGLSWSGPGIRGSGAGLSMGREAAPLLAERLIRPEPRRAAVYRNPIHPAGARAIGVGFPEGVNFAFDADRCQVVTAWTGAFLDPTRQWSARGEGVLLPPGEDVIQLGRQPPFVPGLDARRPWPIFKPGPGGKAPGYRFLGYRFDAGGRVVFRYAVGEIEIEDVPAPMEGAAGEAVLVRVLSIDAPPKTGNLWYLAASGRSIVRDGDGFVVDELLLIRFPGWSGATPVIFQNAAAAELRVDLGSARGGPVELRQEYRWTRTASP